MSQITYVYTTQNIVQSEIKRNHAGYEIFERFLKRAFGPTVKVVISHHLVYEAPVGPNGERMPEEIPSADTLWFSTEYMSRVFGESQARSIMRALILCEPQHREGHIKQELDLLDALEALQQRQDQARMMGLAQTIHEAGVQHV